MHEHHIDAEPMQPSRKCRFSPESPDLAIKLQESFLREIFRFGRIRGHPQTERIDPPLVPIIEGLEGFFIPLPGSFDGLGFVEFGA